jgi:hypothetical protein
MSEEKTEKTKQGLDTVWKEVKKAFVPVGILSAIFIYGPERCAAFLRNGLEWAGEKITDIIERALIAALDIGAEFRSILTGWYRRLARTCCKWLLISIVAVAAYLVLLIVGVMLKSGPFIAIVGIIAGLYFYVVSFVIEKSILASVAVFYAGKTTAELLAKIPKAVLEKIGLEFDGKSKEAANPSKFHEKLRDVRFLGVPFTAIAFWLALFPSWRFYGFLFPFLAGVLSLLLISIWKEWKSRVWYYYHKITKLALVAILVCFAIKSALPEEAQRGFGRFAKNEVMAIVDWLNAPKTQTSPKPVKAEVIVAANNLALLKNNSSASGFKRAAKQGARIAAPEKAQKKELLISEVEDKVLKYLDESDKALDRIKN